MAKEYFKPGNMLYPVPAVMVSCQSGEERPNIITVAWAGTICTQPAMVSISVRPERYSYHMIEESGDYDGDLLLLGDIVLSLERAQAQAEEYGHTLQREVGFLTVHSTLHLLGFDHMEEPYTSVMRAREKEIMDIMDLHR